MWKYLALHYGRNTIFMEHTELDNIESNVAYPYRRINYKMHLLLLTGQILMANGAATDQIKRDLFRAAVYMEIPEDKVHSHINYSTLMLTINDEQHSSHTSFAKCPAHAVNMSIISAVNQLIWRATKRNYPLEKYEKELLRLKDLRKHYSLPLETLGAGLICGGLCKLFGGDLAAGLSTMLCGIIGFHVRRLCGIYGFNPYAGIAISAFVATFLACIMQFASISATPIHPMIAATVFLIPGIPLINAVDDMLEGYLISGITRAVNTIFTLASIAFGIIMALWICGAEDITQVHIQPDDIYISHAFAAILTSIGMSMTFNLPKRFLPIAAIGAVIAVNLRNILVVQCDANIIAGTFAGAAVVGIMGQIINHWIHAPGSVLTIPSVLPLVPGVLLYRLLYSLLNISTIEADKLFSCIQNGIEAVTIITAITIGVTIPMLFFRPYLEKYQRKHIERLLVSRYLDKN